MKTFKEFLKEAKEKPSPDEIVKTISTKWNRNQNRDPKNQNLILTYNLDPLKNTAEKTIYILV
jgi:hypothetical protein